MRKLLATPLFAILAVFGSLQASCSPSPAPPSNLMLGDSVAYEVGAALPDTDNQAVGGTTACDTAANLPGLSPKRLVLHVGGHSWGQYDAATWQACTLSVIDTFLARGSEVYVATAPTPLAIFCQWGSYEFDLRIQEANAWKLNTLRTLRPQVRIVDWRGFETERNLMTLDCEHLTSVGTQQAVDATQAAF